VNDVDSPPDVIENTAPASGVAAALLDVSLTLIAASGRSAGYSARRSEPRR
jgi:hypothetical protein